MLENSHTDIDNIEKLKNISAIKEYLKKNNMKIEIYKDIQRLKDIIENIPKEDYPYKWDEAFNKKWLETNNYFCLCLYQDNKLIGTYAARHMDINNYLNEIKDIFSDEKVAKDIFFEVSGAYRNCWYSSLQWISKNARGNRIGVFLDYIKKSLVFEFFNADFNYAIHKEALCDYHIKKLNYDYTEWLMTVEKGNIGGAGGPEDKIYYLCNISKQNWLSKQDDLYNNYL